MQNSDVIVLGDMGGQLELFRDTLKRLGVEPGSYRLPLGKVVIQVGDVARASTEPYLDSDACVMLANRVLIANPSRYIQLMGNHEAAMIGNFYVDRPGVRYNAIIEDWWTSRRALLAVGITTSAGEQVLVTHAGLTKGQWTGLGRPPLAELVTTLNKRVGGPIEAESSAGSLLTGRTNVSADVMWAEVNSEFYGPWIEGPELPPFNFVHGHASPFSWENDGWWPSTSKEIKRRTTLDRKGRLTYTALGRADDVHGRSAVCVDWGVNEPHPVSGHLWSTFGTITV